MARYRKIEVKIWNDERFRKLSPIPPCGQGLYFYLLTGPDTTSIPGLFRTGEAALAEALGWDLKGLREGYQEGFRLGLVKADWKARLVWLPEAIKSNAPDNPNVVKSWQVYWDELPECDLKREAAHYIQEFLKGYGKGFHEAFAKLLGEGYTKGYQKGYGETGTGTGTGTGEETKTKKVAFATVPQTEPESGPERGAGEADQTVATERPNGSISLLLRDFSAKLTAKLGEKPAGAGWSGFAKHLQILLKDYLPEEVSRRVDFYLESTDPFIVSKSWTPLLFSKNVNARKNGPLNGVKNGTPAIVGEAAPTPGKYAHLREAPAHA